MSSLLRRNMICSLHDCTGLKVLVSTAHIYSFFCLGSPDQPVNSDVNFFENRVKWDAVFKIWFCNLKYWNKTSNDPIQELKNASYQKSDFIEWRMSSHFLDWHYLSKTSSAVFTESKREGVTTMKWTQMPALFRKLSEPNFATKRLGMQWRIS